MLLPCPYPVCKGKVFSVYSFFFPHRLGFVQVLDCPILCNLKFRSLIKRNRTTRREIRVNHTWRWKTYVTAPPRVTLTPGCLNGSGRSPGSPGRGYRNLLGGDTVETDPGGEFHQETLPGWRGSDTRNQYGVLVKSEINIRSITRWV